MKEMLKSLLRKIFVRLVSVKKVIVFESNPDFSDNTYWLFKYIAEHEVFTDYKFVWFIADYSKKKDSLFGVPITCVDHSGRTICKLIRRWYYTYSAKIIFDCNRCINKVRKGQIRIYTTHGMGIKKVLDYIKSIGSCDVLTVMGKGFDKQFSPYVEGQILPWGLPRNEILSCSATSKDNLKIIWMPTFRQHNKQRGNSIDSTFPLGVPVLKSETDLEKLNNFLDEKNVTLYIRLHPAQNTSFFKICSSGRIVLADDAFLKEENKNLYEFIAETSALITDYSSVYYDYLLTEKPIGLTIEDIEAFRSKWGLWLDDIRTELPGFQIDTLEDMLDFIASVVNNEDRYLIQRKELCVKYGIAPCESCKKIVDYCIRELNDDKDIPRAKDA